MRRSIPHLWVVGFLLIAGLACAQSGEIISPEEATQRAEEARNVVFSGSGETFDQARLQPGEMAELVGTSFIINFFDRPGGRIIAGQERGAIVEIVEVVDDGERFWYKINAPTGEGWVTENSVEKVAGESAEEGGGSEVSGPAPGDTVYLAGTGFIINLLKEPNGLINAGQERGAQVVIVEVYEQDGELWYRVRAPGGEGWVSADHISVEAP